MVLLRSLPVLLVAALMPTTALAGSPPDREPAAAVEVGGNAGRFSLRSSDASLDAVQQQLFSRTGLHLSAPEDLLERRLVLDFPELPARDAVARIGLALGGLVPLRVTYPHPSVPDRLPPESEYYLVRPGSWRQRLVDAYGLCRPGGATLHLLERIKSEGASVVADVAAHARDTTRGERERVMTIKLLGSLGFDRAAAPLVAILREDGEALPREAAAIALGWAGRPETIPQLRRSLADPEPGVALGAAWALARLGDASGVPLALAQLRDSGSPMGLRALEVIAASGDLRNVPALKLALPELRGLARIRAQTTIAGLEMAHLGEAAKIDACERLLADANFEIRRYGAAALARIGTPAALSTLERVAADSSQAGNREALDVTGYLKRPPPSGPATIE